MNKPSRLYRPRRNRPVRDFDPWADMLPDYECFQEDMEPSETVRIVTGGGRKGYQ